MAKCRGFTKTGQHCTMPAGANGWCWNHRPERGAEEERRDARSRGGRVGTARTLTPDEAHVSFESTDDVTALLASICEWTLTGKLDAKTANAVVYAAATALRSLDQGDVERQLAELRAAVEALRTERAA